MNTAIPLLKYSTRFDFFHPGRRVRERFRGGTTSYYNVSYVTVVWAGLGGELGALGQVLESGGLERDPA